MNVEVRLLRSGDEAVFARVAEEVFDNAVDPNLTREFLADPRHHIAVALDDGLVVGFASGLHYVHPDKPAELWINEVGVAPPHRRQGVGGRLIAALLTHGRALGCVNAWVLTDRDNEAARALYTKSGGVEGADGLGESLRGFAFDLAGR
jgi:ribosomal protein S18 acetylase RimI-like enzyme